MGQFDAGRIPEGRMAGTYGLHKVFAGFPLTVRFPLRICQRPSRAAPDQACAGGKHKEFQWFCNVPNGSPRFRAVDLFDAGRILEGQNTETYGLRNVFAGFLITVRFF